MKILFVVLLMAIGNLFAEEDPEAVTDFKARNKQWVRFSFAAEFQIEVVYFLAITEEESDIVIVRPNPGLSRPLILPLRYEHKRGLASHLARMVDAEIRKLAEENIDQRGGLGGTWVEVLANDMGKPSAKRKRYILESQEPEIEKRTEKVIKNLFKLTGVSTVANFRIHVVKPQSIEKPKECGSFKE